MTILGCSPTLVRALIPHGEPEADMSSLRVFLTTGEPWNPEPVPLALRAGGGFASPDRQHHRRYRGRGRLPGLVHRGADQSLLRRRACARDGDGRRRRRRAVPRRHGRGRRARVPQAVPRDDARVLGRPRALPGDVLAPLPGHLDARRLGVRRRRRLLVPARPLRRHAEHRRQAHRAGRDRVGRGRPSGRDRGCSRRRPARGQGRGRVGLLRARTGQVGARPRRWPTWSPPIWARHSRPTGSSSCPRCRKPARPRSSGGPSGRPRSGPIPATSRRSRTPRRSRTIAAALGQRF